MDVKTLPYFKEVADVLGEESAELELLKVVASDIYFYEGAYVIDHSFIWEDTPQEYDFWALVAQGVDPRPNNVDQNKALRYFGYCPESGFETFKTKEEAIAYADEAIQYFRDHSDEGWDESVSNVSWGVIKQESRVIDTKTIKEAEEDLGLILDTAVVSGYAEYGLVDL